MKSNLELKVALNDLAIEHLENTVAELRDEVRSKLKGDGTTDEGGFAGNSGDYSAQASNSFLSEQASIRRAEAEQYQLIINRLKGYKFTEELDSVEMLSLVETNHGWFFITQAVKPLMFQGVRYSFLAVDAPIYSEIHGKKKGDKIQFNGIDFEIKSVC
jgi:hypothetical protein